MTQEEKELLLKDLCGRLPYGIIIQGINPDGEQVVEKLFTIALCEDTFDCNMIELSNIKPYLRPMSSMTGDEVIEYLSLKESIIASDDISYAFETYESIDWLNKNMFDYHDLIPMGLAIDATGLNIY